MGHNPSRTGHVYSYHNNQALAHGEDHVEVVVFQRPLNLAFPFLTNL
jgi:hypothetical protein